MLLFILGAGKGLPGTRHKQEKFEINVTTYCNFSSW